MHYCRTTADQQILYADADSGSSIVASPTV
jgi:hypothetical protein